jgi:hypothetical protein
MRRLACTCYYYDSKSMRSACGAGARAAGAFLAPDDDDDDFLGAGLRLASSSSEDDSSLLESFRLRTNQVRACLASNIPFPCRRTRKFTYRHTCDVACFCCGDAHCGPCTWGALTAGQKKYNTVKECMEKCVIYTALESSNSRCNTTDLDFFLLLLEAFFFELRLSELSSSESLTA